MRFVLIIQPHLIHDFGKRLAANRSAFQDLADRVMAYARSALELANFGFDNLLPDFVARHYLFRALVLDGLEFNKAQVFPCSHLRSVSFPTYRREAATTEDRCNNPRVSHVQAVPSGAKEFASGCFV